MNDQTLNVEAVKDLLLTLVTMWEGEAENAVLLRMVLAQHGVQGKELRKKLAEVAGTRAAKRRCGDAVAAIRKRMIALAHGLKTKQMLEEWIPLGKPH